MFRWFIVFIGVLIFSNAVSAQSTKNILYLVVDGEENQIARDNPIFQKLYNNIGNFLVESGFETFEESQETIEMSRSKEEALEVLHDARKQSFDIAVLLSLSHISELTPVGTEEKTFVNFELYNPQTISKIELFNDEYFKLRPEAENCVDECLSSIIRENIKQMLPSLEYALVQRLDEASQSKDKSFTGIYLTFFGFYPNEVRAVKDRLADMPATQKMIFIDENRGQIKFSLYRDEDTSSVKSDLIQVLSFLDLKSQIFVDWENVEIRKVAPSLAFLN
ncbi:MAG: hypothetical protein ACNI26_08500 [Terasakiella sp.]|uniref:hypothetical protein n=1 Tax=unclassified Terasakiella TaxID=2614952 RepID=UPI003B007C38